MVSTKVCRSGQNIFFTNICRNHSNTFLLPDLQKNRSIVKYCSKGYLFWYHDFDRFRQVAVDYFKMSIPLLKFIQYIFLESFDSLDKSVLLHRRYLMSKFSEILILVCRKIFSAFYPILHETFSNSYGFPLKEESNPFYPCPLLYDMKHFCSILTDLSKFSFLFLQKFHLLSYDLKNILTKQFPKIHK